MKLSNHIRKYYAGSHPAFCRTAGITQERLVQLLFTKAVVNYSHIYCTETTAGDYTIVPDICLPLRCDVDNRVTVENLTLEDHGPETNELFINLDLRDGCLDIYRVNPITNRWGGINTDVVRGLVRRYPVDKSLSAKELVQLVRTNIALFQAVLTCSEETWNGHNWVGSLSEEGEKFEAALIEALTHTKDKTGDL